MNFKEYFNINELFNLSVPIKWSRKTHNDWHGIFNINSGKNKKVYLINMIKTPDMPWEVTFELNQGNKYIQDITGTVGT